LAVADGRLSSTFAQPKRMAAANSEIAICFIQRRTEACGRQIGSDNCES
jgi:hypothetical protein